MICILANILRVLQVLWHPGNFVLCLRIIYFYHEHKEVVFYIWKSCRFTWQIIYRPIGHRAQGTYQSVEAAVDGLPLFLVSVSVK